MQYFFLFPHYILRNPGALGQSDNPGLFMSGYVKDNSTIFDWCKRRVTCMFNFERWWGDADVADNDDGDDDNDDVDDDDSQKRSIIP
jgi:hypothetical protein